MLPNIVGLADPTFSFKGRWVSAHLAHSEVMDHDIHALRRRAVYLANGAVEDRT